METKPLPALLFATATALTALVTAACPSSPPDPGSTPTPTPAGDGRLTVLVEVDQMQGTPPLQDSQTLGGAQVSLAGIYAPGGLDIEVRHDQNNLPTVPSVRLADLHALLTAFRNLPTPPDGRHVHVLVVTVEAERPDTLGIMFDFGDNNPNEHPDPPMRLLPNQMLERMVRESQGATITVEFIVSGEVTDFMGRNYLMLRKLLRRRNLGNLSL